MGEAEKKSHRTGGPKNIEETSKGSILKHIPGVSEGDFPVDAEDFEDEDFLMNKEDEKSVKFDETGLEENEEYLLEEAEWEDEEEALSDDDDEYWDEEDDEDDLKCAYEKQESELKKRFMEGQ